MTKISLGPDSLFTKGNNPWIDGISYNAQWGTSSLVPTELDISILQPEDQSKYNLNEIAWYHAKATQGGTRSDSWIKDGNPIGSIAKPAEEAIKLAYGTWEDVANIRFNFVEDPSKSDVFVTFAKYNNKGQDERGTLQGSHVPMIATEYFDEAVRSAGYVLESQLGIASKTVASPTPLVLDLNYDAFSGASPSSSSFVATIIHEVGHGIGMSHPHDKGLGSVPSGVFPGIQSDDSFAFNGTGLYGLNQNVYTNMSYNGRVDVAGNVIQAVTPMALELLAGQIKYGANRSTQTGNNTYSLYEQTLPASKAWACIWDAGGMDTVSAKGLSVDTVISLRPAEMNTERPENGMPQEQYVWNKAWSDFGLALDFIVNIQSSQPGALLGSGVKLAYETNISLSETEGFGLSIGRDVTSELRSTLESLDDSLSIIYEAYGFNGAYKLLYDGERIPKDADKRITKAVAQAMEDLHSLQNNSDYQFLNPRSFVFENYLRTSQYATITIEDYYEGLDQAVDLQSKIQTRSAQGVAGYISEISRSAVSSLPFADRPGGGFTIAAGVTIEKAIGGSGNDKIVGNAANNVIHGKKGDDLINPYLGSNRIIGGAGVDRVDFNTGLNDIRFEDLTFEKAGNWLNVTMGETGEVNSLKSIEFMTVGDDTYPIDSLANM